MIIINDDKLINTINKLINLIIPISFIHIKGKGT